MDAIEPFRSLRYTKIYSDNKTVQPMTPQENEMVDISYYYL